MSQSENTRPPVEVYLEGRYRTVTQKSSGATGSPLWVAFLATLPGCMVQAETEPAAVKKLEQVREPFIRALYEAGAELPMPDSIPDMVILGSVIRMASRQAPAVLAQGGVILPPVPLEMRTLQSVVQTTGPAQLTRV
jgi:predicted RNase H-like HicB family nuclease